MKNAVVNLSCFCLVCCAVTLFAAESLPIKRVVVGSGSIYENSSGDEWAPTWADDDALYTANDDGVSFGGLESHRNIAFGKLVGDEPFALQGTSINAMDYGYAGEYIDGSNWKAMNTYCVDGVLYMGIAKCYYPEQSGDPLGRHRFYDSSIIKSTDHGKTWTRPREENEKKPMFPGDRFGTIYFLWYGQDGAATVDNADKFIYAVSNNGHFEDGDDVILGRVPREKLAGLNPDDWQFYVGGGTKDGMLDSAWSSDMNSATPIISDAYNLGMTGMTYIPELNRYVTVQWHYSGKDLRIHASTTLDFYESPKPWGPFTKFATYDCSFNGYYCPIIGQKFQVKKQPDRVDAIMYVTGYYTNPSYYKMISVPVSFYTSDAPLKPQTVYCDNENLSEVSDVVEKKTILGRTGIDFGLNHKIQADVKIDSFEASTKILAGVSLCCDPYFAKGYNLVFTSSKKLALANDGGEIVSIPYDWKVGQWYHFELLMLSDVLYGKVWAKGEPEPAEYTLRLKNCSRLHYPLGFPALSASGGGDNSASFANISITSLPVTDKVRSVGGKVTARGEKLPNETKENAFDGELGNKWLDYSRETWIQYEMPEKCVISKYKMTSANDYSRRDPASWILLGSNDAKNWTRLDLRNNQTWADRFTTRMFEFENVVAYKYYKFDSIKPHSEDIVSIAEIFLIEQTVTVLPLVAALPLDAEDKNLDGTWQVLEQPLRVIGESGLETVKAATENWMPAQVPGEIHLDIVRAGKMPDPCIGENSTTSRWPETKSWWYKTTFAVDEDFIKHERQLLIFDGLDLYAQIFLNGKLIGEAKNAFVPAEFDITWLLNPGENELVVRMTVGAELVPEDSPPGSWNAPHTPDYQNTPPGYPQPAKPGDTFSHRHWYGNKYLRKPQYAYGWDWVDALPSIGIGKSVRLEGRSQVVLPEIRLDTLLQDGRVSLEMEAIIENLHPWSERACTLQLKIDPPQGNSSSKSVVREYSLDAFPGQTPVRDVIEIPNAQLWWPNGIGAQPLYKVTATVVDSAGVARDSKEFSIGLRTIKVDRSKLTDGTRFCVQVNGKDVFCKGGNIGPQDAFLARVTAEKYDTIVREARDAHMNMIRINGTSVYESPYFYEACNKYGVMIFHDFPFSCTTYPDHLPEFREAVRAEATTAVKMLRHHPSIALWTASNECLMGFRDWWGNSDASRKMAIGGAIVYNQILPEICRLHDPHRLYTPGSPVGGANPSNDHSGDVHWWWAALSGNMAYRVSHESFDDCRSRFVSEYGVLGPAHPDSINEYLTPEQQNPESQAWKIHTNEFDHGTLNYAIKHHYADLDTFNLEAYVRYGQLYQMFLHEHIMEALRFRKNDSAADCQGALIWAYTDTWGETGWSLIDYYLRRKPSYYGFRRACAPIKIITRKRGDNLVTRLVNDTLESANFQVEYGWWKLDGTDKNVKTKAVAIEANGMVEIDSEKISPAEERDPTRWLYASVLKKDGVAVDQSVWTLSVYRNLETKQADISVKSRGDGVLEVSSPVFVHAIYVDDKGKELVSNNWFDLLPGVPVRVNTTPSVKSESIKFQGSTNL